ncbi:sigma 54-interacting transcriptional regulator [Zhongshania sp.]|jgi:transcriptional regulator with PAS, ATPase and Fis domain|uniref:sigma-54 interaction domain-containing protein n=1 Tax=Zhongshania sp. TaxID=1971902 RepID=UPI001B7901D7|nr:sigma 54-interacting transcriptional regulator [Zhongshania sp.]MBQ0796484.1 sigma 54-interacting transcriptional regulator [Zhongshania sp.]
MQLIAKDSDKNVAYMLDGFDYPAILVSADYRILATNELYRSTFGEIDVDKEARCYQVSHGYQVPCDQAGESCPLLACKSSGSKERVLHVHTTPRGKEHVDVEMLPIHGEDGELKYFVEILKPVHIASAELSTQNMVGRSPAFNALVEMINLVAGRDTSVLLMGESGTGKELAAKAIHEASRRSTRPMITVECAGLTETLFESELFGHVKGAFTGATSNKRGLLESAEGGTLFLDEIGDVPLGMQVKLLRLIETGSYRAVGSTELKRANFRLICATHKNLSNNVASGEFREDLYYRINAFPIVLPPLRERGDDIALIAKSILEKFSKKDMYRLTESAIKLLEKCYFAGNVRELRNVLERAIIFAHSNIIDVKILERCMLDVRPHNDNNEDKWQDLKSKEMQYLNELLAFCDGDKARAAHIAGISLRSFYRKFGVVR